MRLSYKINHIRSFINQHNKIFLIGEIFLVGVCALIASSYYSNLNKESNLYHTGETLSLVASASAPEVMGWGNGGWFTSIEIDKFNSNILYAVNDMGGFFRSEDGGSNWTDLSINFPGTPVWNLTFSPDGNTIYTQTRLALLKSTDKGNNWQALTAQHEYEVTSTKPFASRFKAAYKRSRTVVIDPISPNTIYLVGEKGLDNHDVMLAMNYLYKSTDGGQNWTRLSSIADNTNSLVLDVNNRSVLYSGGPDGVRKSTDGGSTWIAKNSGVSNLNVLDMVSVSKNGSLVLYLLTDSGFYISTNGAESWSSYNKVTDGSTIPTIRSYGSILVDQSNSNHIFISLKGYVYESKDGASNWSMIFRNWGMEPTTDSGYAYTWHCGLLHCGGPTTALAYNPITKLLYGVGDVGLATLNVSTTPYPSWAIKSRGLYVAVNFALSFFSKDEIIAGGADTVLMRTENGGQTWKQIAGPKKTDGTWTYFPSNFWVRSIGLKKTTPRKIYVCNENISSTPKAGLHQTLDNGNTWENIISRLSDASTGGKCSQVFVDSSNENIVYVLIDNKGLYRSTDNATSFTRITDSITGINELTFNSSSFAIDPASPSTFYLVSQNGSKVFKSTNSGSSWTQLNQPYISSAVGGIVVFPDTYHTVYLSQQHRLLRSRDQGLSWQVVLDLGTLVKNYYGSDYTWSWHYYFSIPVYNPSNQKTYIQVTPWTHDPQNLPPVGIYISSNFGDTWEKSYSLAHPGSNQIYILNENDYLYVPTQSGVWKYRLDTASIIPTLIPTISPTAIPTAIPTSGVNTIPTISPTATPTIKPTATPTIKPTATPTIKPTATPTVKPTATPTVKVSKRNNIKPTPTSTLGVSTETALENNNLFEKIKIFAQKLINKIF